MCVYVCGHLIHVSIATVISGLLVVAVVGGWGLGVCVGYLTLLPLSSSSCLQCGRAPAHVISCTGVPALVERQMSALSQVRRSLVMLALACCPCAAVHCDTTAGSLTCVQPRRELVP